MLLELAVPAFFLIWFGLGALIVGMAMLVGPGLPLASQVSIWVAASIGLIILWMKVFKAHVHRTRIGLSTGQFAGENGLVTREIKPFEKGQIRFQKPILGSDVWLAISTDVIKSGERVEVLGVEGNILRVAKKP